MTFVTAQLRRGTAAAWSSANPTLAEGEVGLETDTQGLKIGDGSTAFNSLPYANKTTTETVSGTTYSLVAADRRKIKQYTNTSGCTVTIPLNATTSIPVGHRSEHIQTTTGEVVLAPETGVTVYGRSVWFLGRGAKVTLTKIATDAWEAEGDLSSDIWGLTGNSGGSNPGNHYSGTAAPFGNVDGQSFWVSALAYGAAYSATGIGLLSSYNGSNAGCDVGSYGNGTAVWAQYGTQTPGNETKQSALTERAYATHFAFAYNSTGNAVVGWVNGVRTLATTLGAAYRAATGAFHIMRRVTNFGYALPEGAHWIGAATGQNYALTDADAADLARRSLKAGRAVQRVATDHAWNVNPAGVLLTQSAGTGPATLTDETSDTAADLSRVNTPVLRRIPWPR